MPSGHVPQDAVEHPQMYGGIDCLIRLPQSAIDDMREYLAEQVGARENFQNFYPSDFLPIATQVHTSLGSPGISLLTAWNIFTKMSDIIESHHLY